MSGLLVFRWIVPVFALAVAATVWVVGGPMAAGLCLIAFLLGVVTCELHHMRWQPVEEPAAAAGSDSAFLALMAAGAAPAPVEPGAPVAPPSPPKRNFRVTCQGLAIGSGEIRLAVVERHGLHARAAERRREAAVRPEPAATLATPEPAQPEAEVVEPVLQLESDMVELLLVPAAPEPPSEAAPAMNVPRPPPRANAGVPPPKVTVLAPPAPDRKRAISEAFRSSYVTRTPR